MPGILCGKHLLLRATLYTALNQHMETKRSIASSENTWNPSTGTLVTTARFGYRGMHFRCLLGIFFSVEFCKELHRFNLAMYKFKPLYWQLTEESRDGEPLEIKKLTQN